MSSVIEVTLRAILIAGLAIGVFIFFPVLLVMGIYASIVFGIFASVQLVYMIIARTTGNDQKTTDPDVPTDPNNGDTPELTRRWNMFKATLNNPARNSPIPTSGSPAASNSTESVKQE